MPLPIAAVAGLAAGGAGGLLQGISSFFGGGGPDLSQDKTGGGWAYRLLEKSPYGRVPWGAGGDLYNAWRYGQLPRPLQRAMQSIYPMTQMMYSGITDEAALGASSAREDVARRMQERGVTGPQMTKYLQDIDYGLRLADLNAARQGQGLYANALANAWQDVYQRGFDEPARLMSIAAGVPSAGSNTPNLLSGAGNMLGAIGTGLVDYAGWGGGGTTGGGWSGTTDLTTLGGYGTIPKPGIPSLGSTGEYSPSPFTLTKGITLP